MTGIVETGARTTKSVVICARDLITNGLPDTLVYMTAGLGDALMATALVRAIQRERRRKVWMMADGASLFGGNDDVRFCADVRPKLAVILKKFGTDVRHPAYGVQGLAEEPMMVQLLRSGGFRGTAILKPFLTLSDDERGDIPDEMKKAGGEIIAIHSSARTARYRVDSKEWYPDRFQKVAESLVRRGYTIVQLGSAGDPPLGPFVIDLRGKTTLRQSAAVLARAQLFVGLEGFLVHLARAVDRRSVVVLGGRTRWYHFGYPCNVHLSTELPCTGCFLQTPCPNAMRCMGDISPEMVLDAIDNILTQVGRRPETFEADVTDAIVPLGHGSIRLLPVETGKDVVSDSPLSGLPVGREMTGIPLRQC